MKNAQMWQLGGDPHAPLSLSMRQLCWDCREAATHHKAPAEAPILHGEPYSVLTEAYEIVRRYEENSAEQV
ncbi:MAG: hypothetical protein ABI068_01455 [Ktedonobacterales bacterium]